MQPNRRSFLKTAWTVSAVRICFGHTAECFAQAADGSTLCDELNDEDWNVAVKATGRALLLDNRHRDELLSKHPESVSLRLLFESAIVIGGDGSGADIVKVFEKKCGIRMPIRTRDILLSSKISNGRMQMNMSGLQTTSPRFSCNEWAIEIGGNGRQGLNHILLRGDGGVESRIEWTESLLPGTSLNMATNETSIFMTAFNNGAMPFLIVAWNHKEERIMWSATCRGADFLAVVMGYNPQWVDMRVVDGEVRIFGVTGTTYFAEAFDIKTGLARWRFCTRLLTDAQ